MCHSPEDYASRKKPLSWSNVKNGAVKASAAVMPALSGRKKLRILQDHKQICTVEGPVLCINKEMALQHQHFYIELVLTPHVSRGWYPT